jgi:hypothetical protein
MFVAGIYKYLLTMQSWRGSSLKITTRSFTLMNYFFKIFYFLLVHRYSDILRSRFMVISQNDFAKILLFLKSTSNSSTNKCLNFWDRTIFGEITSFYILIPIHIIYRYSACAMANFLFFLLIGFLMKIWYIAIFISLCN